MGPWQKKVFQEQTVEKHKQTVHTIHWKKQVHITSVCGYIFVSALFPFSSVHLQQGKSNSMTVHGELYSSPSFLTSLHKQMTFVKAHRHTNRVETVQWTRKASRPNYDHCHLSEAWHCHADAAIRQNSHILAREREREMNRNRKL